MQAAPTQEEYSEALRELESRHPTVKFELPMIEGLALIGAIQLAMRHPLFPAATEKVCRSFIQSFEDGLESSPVITTTIQMGFDPAYDLDV